MAVTNYVRLRQRLARIIADEPTTATFYQRGGGTIEATGRLAPAGSRTFGRSGLSAQLPGTAIVGSQLHVLELPYDTTPPNVNDEVRTTRGSVEQRFTVVAVLPSPWKVEVVIDATG